jgi:polysaccharide biosynthesis protein PslG
MAPVTETIDTATERADKAFFGLHAEKLLDPAYEDRLETFDKVAATRVGTLRRVFSWQEIEIAPDVYDFSAHDELVAQAAARGIRVLPVLFAPPRWRSSRPMNGAVRGTYPPASNDEFAAFAQLLVARYGPAGSLWSERPELPFLPIVAWQVWNEPNIPVYWPSGPDAREYTRMLETVAAAIRHADPGAKIVSAALPDSALGVRYDTFLAQMYEAGARGSFDFAAINPYSRSAEGVYRILKRARDVVDQHGDDARLWATEIGWASDGPESRLNVGEHQQAHLIGTVLPTLVQQAGALRLHGVIYFGWQDAVPYPGGHDFWGLHTGLLRLDGSGKQAYWRFVKAVEVLTR